MRLAFITALLCVGLVAASVTIPLKKHQITATENNAKVFIDEILYA